MRDESLSSPQVLGLQACSVGGEWEHQGGEQGGERAGSELGNFGNFYKDKGKAGLQDGSTQSKTTCK